MGGGMSMQTLINPVGIGNKEMSYKKRLGNMLIPDPADAFWGEGSIVDDKKKDGAPISDTDQQAKSIEQAAAEAEALAEQEAKDAARKKLAQQTQTIFTSGLGLLGTKPNTGTTTLGNN